MVTTAPLTIRCFPYGNMNESLMWTNGICVGVFVYACVRASMFKRVALMNTTARRGLENCTLRTCTETCGAPSGLRPQVREIWRQIILRQRPLGKWINTKKGRADKVVTAVGVWISEGSDCEEYSLLECDDMIWQNFGDRNVGKFRRDYRPLLSNSHSCVSTHFPKWT